MQHVPSHDFGVDIRLGRRPAFGGGCDVGLLLLVPVAGRPVAGRVGGRVAVAARKHRRSTLVSLICSRQWICSRFLQLVLWCPDLQSISSINPVVS